MELILAIFVAVTTIHVHVKLKLLFIKYCDDKTWYRPIIFCKDVADAFNSKTGVFRA